MFVLAAVVAIFTLVVQFVEMNGVWVSASKTGGELEQY
jgi:hypothetical protein